MSITILSNIRKLVHPFMQSTFIRPTGDDGLHMVGLDRHGAWQEFYSVEQATAFANRERFADMQAREANK